MRELTLIGVTVNLPSGVRACIAVLGPMRMHYEPGVISAGSSKSARHFKRF